MAFSGYLVNRNKSKLIRGYQELVSLSGRQRFLVSQVGLITNQLGRQTDVIDREKLKVELERNVSELELAHDILLNGSLEQGIADAPPAVRDIFLGSRHELDRHVQEFVASTRKIIQAENVERSELQPTIDRLVESDGVLLKAMDAVVLAYTAESDVSFARIRAVETSIVVLTMVVIAVTGIGVFWPMVRRVRSETNELENFNAVLDQRAAELATTLQALEQERDERRSRMQAMASVLEDLEEERGKLEREIQARQLVQDALAAS